MSPYPDALTAATLDLALGVSEPCTYDPHDGGDHSPTHRISLVAIGQSLKALHKIPRNALHTYERGMVVAQIDRQFGRPTTPELIDAIEAALEVISERGGPAGEEAEDLLCRIEDRLSSLRARLRGDE